MRKGKQVMNVSFCFVCGITKSSDTTYLVGTVALLHGQGFIISVPLTMIHKVEDIGDREPSNLQLCGSSTVPVSMWLNGNYSS